MHEHRNAETQRRRDGETQRKSSSFGSLQGMSRRDLPPLCVFASLRLCVSVFMHSVLFFLIFTQIIAKDLIFIPLTKNMLFGRRKHPFTFKFLFFLRLAHPGSLKAEGVEKAIDDGKDKTKSQRPPKTIDKESRNNFAYKEYKSPYNNECEESQRQNINRKC